MCLFLYLIVSNYVTGGLKAQKHIAQGIALGMVGKFVRPVRAKALIYEVMLLPLQGEITNLHLPRAMP